VRLSFEGSLGSAARQVVEVFGKGPLNPIIGAAGAAYNQAVAASSPHVGEFADLADALRAMAEQLDEICVDFWELANRCEAERQDSRAVPISL
jgi:hypothetical protein